MAPCSSRAAPALIGASNRPGSVGQVMARNLALGGFKGTIHAVNPKPDPIAGLPTVTDIAALPEAPDLAVIATPPATVPGLVDALGRRGTRGVIVITAGVAHQAVLQAAKPNLVRIIGPNCVGAMVPGIGLNATFAHWSGQAWRPCLHHPVRRDPDRRDRLDAPARHRFLAFGFAGRPWPMSFGDLLDYLGRDTAARAMLMYVEGITTRAGCIGGRAASRA